MTRRGGPGLRPGAPPVGDAGSAESLQWGGTTGSGWHARAACVVADPELFVGDRRGGPEAFAFCERCPVVAHCEELATRNGENYGVWGGSLRG